MRKSSLFTLFVYLSSAIIVLAWVFPQRYAGLLSSATFPDNPDYKTSWRIVDSLLNKGLTESARKRVETIYDKAKKENNPDHLVKAILYRMKLVERKEENALEKSIYQLEKECAMARYPAKPVLHSILADAYWKYYTNNRYKFLNRSQTPELKKEDISTWDLNYIVDQSILNYQLSLNNPDSLKRTTASGFNEIIHEGNGEGRKIRPTLYDLLAHRAIAFFSSSEADLNKPASGFNLNSEDFLKSNVAFTKIDLNHLGDSLNLKFYALKTYQDLEKFHLKRNDIDALVPLILDRLSFVQKQSIREDKDSIYLQTLQKMKSDYSNHSSLSEIYFDEATWYRIKASLFNGSISNEYKNFNQLAYQLAQKGSGLFPKSYGATHCRALMDQIKMKSLRVTVEQVQQVNKPFRALVEYKNHFTAWFRIARIDHQQNREWQHKYYSDKLLDKYKSLPAITTFSLSLPSDEDYNDHGVEIKCPELEPGHYVMLSSTTADFSYESNCLMYNTFWVSNLSYLSRKNSEGDLDVFVVDRFTGDPIGNANVNVWAERYNYKQSKYVYEKERELVSDKDGKINVQAPIGNGNYFHLELVKGNDRYYSTQSFYVHEPYKNDYVRPRTFIFTDRAIYRPGQTIFFKAIRINGKGQESQIAPNEPINLKLYDVNYQVVSNLDLTTNEYGTCSGTFVAPQGVLNGQMHITDGYGNTFFSVEEYKRPKFETSFEAVKGMFQINDSVEVKGIAKAFSGNRIDGAKVKYRVVRNVQIPWWHNWYYRGRSLQSTEISNGFVSTNDTGGYIIRFKALPDPTVALKSDPIFNYTIYADVSDINGETHATSTYLRVGTKSLELSFQNEENYFVDSIRTIGISARNLNGQKEYADGEYNIYKVKVPENSYRNRLWDGADKFLYTEAEYHRYFPNDLYQDENNELKWDRGEVVVKGNFSTQKSEEIELSQLKKLGEGYYCIEANTKDKYNKPVKALSYFSLIKAGGKSPKNDIFYQWSIKTYCEPGEDAVMMMGSAVPNTKILMQVEKDGKANRTEFITASSNEIKIETMESDRGNYACHFAMIKYNRVFTSSVPVVVPFSNKELNVRFETFRDKLLPGEKEQWKIVVSDKKGAKQQAEMLAAMYDASLDAFARNQWNFNVFDSRYYSCPIDADRVYVSNSSPYCKNWNNYSYGTNRYFDQLNYFGLSFYSYRYYDYGDYDNEEMEYKKSEVALGGAPAELSEVTTVSANAQMPKKNKFRSKDREGDDAGVAFAEPLIDADVKSGATVTREESKNSDKRAAGKSEGGETKVRSNFNETAFFYPHLESNEKGELIISFTLPESLTRWKVMTLAHSKDLKSGMATKELVAQKELMVQTNLPRFFRENDAITLSTKVSNLTNIDLNATASLQIIDPFTLQDISSQFGLTKLEQSINIKKSLSTAASWELKIPEGVSAISCRIKAKSTAHSDAEEITVPILTNRMLVTESMPLPIRGITEKEFNFEKFISQNNHSTTLRNHSFTLEFTANPAWYAIQALPYLIEYPYECAEQTFSRYYANSLASHIVNSKPKIKSVFDAWKNYDKDAFLSNLQKNQELKSVLLEETPWVMEAKDESERKKRVGLLFDLNRMGNELQRAITKLQKMQTSNGGWPWFEGMPEDWYITQHVVTGMGHLDRLGVKNIREDEKVWSMVRSAVLYCDNALRRDYDEIKRWDKDYEKNNHLHSLAIHYMYARGYFKDIPIPKRTMEAFNYFKSQAKKHWLTQSFYMQGMIALSLNRFDDVPTAKDIMKSLSENALHSEEMGMYWKDNYAGYYWYQAPIESQALLIEAYDEILKDEKSVDELKTWLLKSKQTQDWKTTKATAEAVYALLLRGTDWLDTEPKVKIQLGSIKIDPSNDPGIKTEAGTGYFKKTWQGSDIVQEMGKIKVKKENVGVSWGAVYWQYFEQLDKITPHETPLKIKKKLFVQEYTAAGPVLKEINDKSTLKPGDKIKVRIELRVDRDMEYVHMKDMRASGFEPINVFSGYRWQGGLGYYESTRDAATHFFFSSIQKGTYVFEYPLYVAHKGDFSNGITSIQCMYAPEFTSHSEGIRVKVKG